MPRKTGRVVDQVISARLESQHVATFEALRVAAGGLSQSETLRWLLEHPAVVDLAHNGVENLLRELREADA